MAISGVGGVSGWTGGMQSRSEGAQLSPEAQQEVNRLRAIDRKVRAHEQAHMAAGAGVTGGASFQFTRGPDGRQYAVGGEVRINVSSGQTPEATIERARIIQAAALAPADPSPQDRAVAAQAAMLEAQARAELSRTKREEAAGGEAQASPVSEGGAQSRAEAAGKPIQAYAQAAQQVTQALGQTVNAFA